MSKNIRVKTIDCGDVKKVDYYIITIEDRYGKYLHGTFYDITRICYYYKLMDKLHRYLLCRISTIDETFIYMLEFLEKNNCNLSLEVTGYWFKGFCFDNEFIPLVYKFASSYMTKLQQEFAEYYLSKGYNQIYIKHNKFYIYRHRWYLDINYDTKTMTLEVDEPPQLLRKLIGNRKVRNHDKCKQCRRIGVYEYKIVEEDNRIIIYDDSCCRYQEAFIV